MPAAAMSLLKKKAWLGCSMLVAGAVLTIPGMPCMAYAADRAFKSAILAAAELAPAPAKPAAAICAVLIG